MTQLSDKGLQLILDGEVGGGKPYYDKFCRKPVLPDPEHTQSGITIGIGYDLGQHTSPVFQREWSDYIGWEPISLLSGVCGLKGMQAKPHLARLRQLIDIPWEVALDQFLTHTMPRYWASTCRAFESIEHAPSCVQEAILSLVFNRGAFMGGDRRREMREIRNLISLHRWELIPEQIRSMKRLWPNTKGLLVRREAEAKHIETGLAKEQTHA